MKRMGAAEAMERLAQWREEGAAIYVAMRRSARQRAEGAATIERVLPHSETVVLTMRDANGAAIGVTVDLTAAEWQEGAGETLPEFPGVAWSRFAAAAFPNGTRYIFGERAAARGE
jgi:NAD(P)-dependent dehydrogenase (short-subunit alcohol dehydrogenase family)